MSERNALPGQRVQELVELRLLVRDAVRVDRADLRGLVETARKGLAELGGGGGIAFGDGGAQLLFDRLEFTGAHTVAEIGLLTGAQTLDGGFGVSHFSVLSTWF